MKASVIIPVRTITPYVQETISYLRAQSEKDFEVIIITDNKEKLAGAKIISSGEPTPAFKRNLGVKNSKGNILAFLDDDSYPEKEWLKNALAIFDENSRITAVCGPTLTPPSDNLYQKASGWVWATKLGSGGAGVYRNKVMNRREVDDFPSVNLLVKKVDFEKVDGFDINHWPGEDTKLCLDLINNGGKIIYDPKVLVFHHRRSVFKSHLKQISRYASRRGYFAKEFPKTSFKIGYFMPSLFVAGLLIGAILSFLSPLLRNIYLGAILIYLAMLLVSMIGVYKEEKNLYLSFLVALAIFATHVTYGLLFPFGFLKKEIKTIPHEVDKQGKKYIGG